ncbi:MAG: C-GCAxxG-C-C family protein [bacterium]|nr:C-GCAxxG-C-C family protein [bacterium]
MTREEKAVQYKHEGYNCCQAVVKAMSDLTEVEEDTLLKMSSGFAVGMGCMEATCGSLVGATMIAGLVKEGNGTVMTAREILNKFQEYSGATVCKDLKGRDTGVVLCDCDSCVRNAVRALDEVMELAVR